MTDTTHSFSDLIRAYGNGKLDNRLSAALREVAESVVLLDKDGTITLTLKLSEKGGGIVLSPSVSVKTPEAKDALFYFVDSDGVLTRRDPNQPSIPGTEEYTSD